MAPTSRLRSTCFTPPLYVRLLIGHGPLDPAFTDAVLDLAVEGLR